MRFVVAAALVLQLLPASVASAEDPVEETVSLLVPADAPTGNLTTDDSVSEEIDWKRIEVPVAGSIDETIENVSETLETTAFVENSYPLLGAADEPLFPQQWHLENTGQNGGLSDADIDATQAWSRGDGTGVVVAVVDSGTASSHPDLAGRIWQNSSESINGLDDDGNGFIDDTWGWDFVEGDNDPRPGTSSSDDAHGTALAGVIAAAVNSSGIAGVAPNARIMSLRACSGGSCMSYSAAQAIVYAVNAGADIINLSFGGLVPSQQGEPALQGAIDYARSKDVLVVSAAGNTPPSQVPNGQIFVPAELPGSNNLSVTATDRRDRVASFAYYSPRIDLAAPGVDILTTGLTGYVSVAGSSFSASVVSGAAAQLLSVYPGMTHRQLTARLTSFADKPSHVTARVPNGRLNLGRPAVHPFMDSVNHLFESDIEWAAARGITRGCDPPINISFCPDYRVSREVMAAFLTRALKLPATSRDFFRDDNNSTFEDDINRLAAAGITRGCGPTSFCPKEVVDRGQMAAFLVRALKLSKAGRGDLFDDDDSSIFEADIDRLGTAGITKGCNPPQNNLFCPNLPVDRGAMTAFLHRALD